MYGYQNNFSDVTQLVMYVWFIIWYKHNMILQFSKNQALKPQQALNDNFKSF